MQTASARRLMWLGMCCAVFVLGITLIRNLVATSNQGEFAMQATAQHGIHATLSKADLLEQQWLDGIALYSKGDYSRAVTHLRHVAEQPEFKDANHAHATLIAAYARAGQVAEAENALREWVLRFRPTARMAADYVELVDLAREAKKGRNEE